MASNNDINCLETYFTSSLDKSGCNGSVKISLATFSVIGKLFFEFIKKVLKYVKQGGNQTD